MALRASASSVSKFALVTKIPENDYERKVIPYKGHKSTTIDSLQYEAMLRGSITLGTADSRLGPKSLLPIYLSGEGVVSYLLPRDRSLAEGICCNQNLSLGRRYDTGLLPSVRYRRGGFGDKSAVGCTQFICTQSA